MKSKNTVINNIFSKIAKGKETELNSHKVDLSLANDIDKAYKRTLGIGSDLDFAATEYKDDAIKQSNRFDDMMDADIKLQKAQSEYQEANKDFGIADQKVTNSESSYKNAVKETNQLLKQLSSLEQKANKMVKELGIPPNQFPPLMNALNGQNELITAITQAKTITQGIG
tara:strand:+ start:251 stop:760 length:510 start_codon:yes stop_codon:yes gene_type:complete